MAKSKVEAPFIVTSVGVFSYPYLAEPQKNNLSEKKEESYNCELYIPKADWAAKSFSVTVDGVPERCTGAEMVTKVLAYSREATGNPGLQFGGTSKFKTPFADVDKLHAEKIASGETGFDTRLHGCIRLRAKSLQAPKVKGPDGKDYWNLEQIKTIKGGDLGRLVVNPWCYDVNGNRGVSFGLIGVQFKTKGDPLGRDNAKALELFDAMDVPLEDPNMAGSQLTQF